MIKRLIVVAVTILLVFSIPSQSIQAANATNTDILVETGLLLATEKKSIKSTSSPIKKLDAYVLFIRLKGLDKSVKGYKGKTTYKDSKLVNKTYVPYVNYSKVHPELGWDKKNANFSPSAPVTYSEFTRYMLDLLGYKEGKDYAKDAHMEFAQAIFLLTEDDAANSRKNISVKDAHQLAISALKTFTKSDKLYSQALVEKKVIQAKIVQKHQLHISNEENSLEQQVIEVEEDQ